MVQNNQPGPPDPPELPGAADDAPRPAVCPAELLTLGTAVPGSDAFVCSGCGAHASAAARSGSCCCSGVGSNGTHPAPPKYASTQACASWVETVNFPFSSGLRWV